MHAIVDLAFLSETSSEHIVRINQWKEEQFRLIAERLHKAQDSADDIADFVWPNPIEPIKVEESEEPEDMTDKAKDIGVQDFSGK